MLDGFFDLVAEVHGLVVIVQAEVGGVGGVDFPARGRDGHALLAGFDVAVADAELHVVHVGVVDADRRVEVVGVLVARRVVADGLAFGVFALELVAALADVEVAARDLVVVEDIRIRLAELARTRHHELAVILVDQELHVFAEASGRVESGDSLLVGLAALELGGQVCFGAVAAVVEPGGELGGAVFAHVAVLELAVAEQADLVAAEITILLVKKAHRYSFPAGECMLRGAVCLQY